MPDDDSDTGRCPQGCSQNHPVGRDKPLFTPAAGQNPNGKHIDGEVLIDECKVLVVTAYDLVLQMLVTIFARFGYTVTEAAGGPEAIVYVSRSHYHLVLTDLEMPELDGYQLAHLVKRQSPLTKVVVMTNRGQTEVPRRIVGEVDGWLCKPFKITDLGNLISALKLPNAFQTSSQSK